LIDKPIAREGWGIIAIFFTLCLLFYAFHLIALSILCFLCFLFSLFFFRNPKRIHSSPEGELVAPADGKVTEIRKIKGNQFIEGDSYRISIFMSPLDVHVNRSPQNGKVTHIDYRKGKFSLAFKRDIEHENERNYILIESEDEKILVVQIAGFLARRITCYVKEGDYITKGAPIGIISFGSRVDIYLPDVYDIMIKKGDRLKAGLTPVAKKEEKG